MTGNTIIASVNAPAIPWIKSDKGKARYFSVNTPVGTSADKQCGRAVYSDLHITNTAGPTTIGRDSGGIFAGDSYLSPRHATFTARGRQVMVRDESSLNGVYRKIGRDEPIRVR